MARAFLLSFALPAVRRADQGNDADRRLFVLLDLPRLRHAPQAEDRGLLRVLQLWLGALPAGAIGAWLLRLARPLCSHIRCSTPPIIVALDVNKNPAVAGFQCTAGSAGQAAFTCLRRRMKRSIPRPASISA